jgi:hydrogenase expression/formation protein HypC
MCVALPARIVEMSGDEAWVELGESRLLASLALVPEAGVGDWILVHAGFAIQLVAEEDARETWALVAEIEAAAREEEEA